MATHVLSARAADRSNPSGALGAGCDAIGFDYNDADKFSYETEHMMKAKAFREALIYAIDRDLIGETIVSGYGGAIYGTGHGGGIAFHQSHPEYKGQVGSALRPGRWRGRSLRNPAWSLASSSSTTARRVTAHPSRSARLS